MAHLTEITIDQILREQPSVIWRVARADSVRGLICDLGLRPVKVQIGPVE